MEEGVFKYSSAALSFFLLLIIIGKRGKHKEKVSHLKTVEAKLRSNIYSWGQKSSYMATRRMWK